MTLIYLHPNATNPNRAKGPRPTHANAGPKVTRLHKGRDHLSDRIQPTMIVDNSGFNSLVTAWKYADVWDSFRVVYDKLDDVPERLRNYTIVRNDDPSEAYGALLQMPPSGAKLGDAASYLSRKLLAKVRLN